MKMKQVTVTIPENCELEQNGNIYTIVEKEKKLTYEDVTEKLFPYNGIHYYITNNGDIFENVNDKANQNFKNNATSKRQLEKLFAINKLMNVAVYLNDDWQPDWHDRDKDKIFIYIDYLDNTIKFGRSGIHQTSDIYFKSQELAEQAIEILGEETIRLALCTDY